MTPTLPMSALRRATRALSRGLFLDRQAAFWIGQVDPTWSPREVRARVVEIIDETPDTRTFVLQPNHHWRGHRAGQHTTIEVEIDGVRVRRCYSISSAPSPARRLAITVKRVPDGRVSSWLHDELCPGDVVGLGAAAGDFVLPEPRPAGGLLLLSGGSGITPVMSMLRDLDARGAVDDVVFVHHARSRDHVIFGAELEAIAARRPGLRLLIR
ncbi:MAG: hypothetical protein KC464_10465, partial [Myxococcales bacterium]|nr:hypothetical protein [Myxococcales bacterium]